MFPKETDDIKVWGLSIVTGYYFWQAVERVEVSAAAISKPGKNYVQVLVGKLGEYLKCYLWIGWTDHLAYREKIDLC